MTWDELIAVAKRDHKHIVVLDQQEMARDVKVLIYGCVSKVDEFRIMKTTRALMSAPESLVGAIVKTELIPKKDNP
jgi:hypothetical protein